MNKKSGSLAKNQTKMICPLTSLETMMQYKNDGFLSWLMLLDGIIYLINQHL